MNAIDGALCGRPKGHSMLKPADYVLLAAAFLSFVFSIYLWFSGWREEGLFVGLWVPSILAFGGFMRAALKKG